MPEIRSPLTSTIKPGRYGATDDGGVTLILSEKAPGTLVQLAGWDDFETATEPALAVLGFEGPGDYRMARTEGMATCYRIAPDKLWRIFTRFYRGDEARQAHEEESGLGLAIAKSLVELHGGAISVESTLGEGTTFTIALPVGS